MCKGLNIDMKNALALLILSLCFPVLSHSKSCFSDTTRSVRWYVPHFVPLQFAGNIGFLSAGAGYNSNKQNYQLAVMYGYVPRSIARSAIHTITAKNNFPLAWYGLKNNRTIIPYVGLGLTVEVGGNAFFRMPSHFPESYYDFPKNLHVIAYGGVRLRQLFSDEVKMFRAVELYAEAGTVDVYVWYKTISNQIKFHQIFSLAIGVSLLLDHE
jgi:hypothetical protein